MSVPFRADPDGPVVCRHLVLNGLNRKMLAEMKSFGIVPHFTFRCRFRNDVIYLKIP